MAKLGHRSVIAAVSAPDVRAQRMEITYRTQHREPRPGSKAGTIGPIKCVELLNCSTETGAVVSIDEIQFPGPDGCLVPIGQQHVVSVPEQIAGIGIPMDMTNPQGKVKPGISFQQPCALIEKPLSLVSVKARTGYHRGAQALQRLVNL